MSSSNVIFTLLLVIFIHVLWVNARSVPLESICKPSGKVARSEVVFVVDFSSSAKDHYSDEIQFIRNFVKRVEIGRTAVNIAMIGFATKAWNIISLNDGSNRNSITRTLNNEEKRQNRYGGPNRFTFTKLGMQKGIAEFSSRSVGNRMLVLVTDGKHTTGYDPSKEIAKIKKRGIKLWVVGIGDGFKKNMQDFYKSRADKLLHVSFKEMSNEHFMNIICKPIKEYTPAPLKPLKICEDRVVPTEVVFLMDFSGTAKLHFRNELDFIRNFVQSVHLGPNHVEVAIMLFRSLTEVYAKLTADKKILFQALETIDQKFTKRFPNLHTFTDDGVREARKLFSKKLNIENRILILATDGKHTDEHNPAIQIQQAKRDGIDVVIVGIELDKAISYEYRALADQYVDVSFRAIKEKPFVKNVCTIHYV